MNEQIKIQSLYNEELEKEINCLLTETLKIEGKDFGQKLKVKDKKNEERKRIKYKFNQKIFEEDNNFDFKNENIFISMEYENSSNKQGNDSFLNTLKFNIKKNQSDNYNNNKKEENTELEEDEESENENENRINEIKGNNKKKKKKAINLFKKNLIIFLEKKEIHLMMIKSLNLFLKLLKYQILKLRKKKRMKKQR